jgi:hypothetical protein
LRLADDRLPLLRRTRTWQRPGMSPQHGR